MGKWLLGVSVAVVAVLTVVAILMANGVGFDPLPGVPSWVLLVMAAASNTFVWWLSRRSRAR